MSRSLPTKKELYIFDKGYQLIGAMDEVGKGAWAGPVSVGVILVDKKAVLESSSIPEVSELRDSKTLNSKTRCRLASFINSWVADCQVGHASAQEIDAVGIDNAISLAALRAVNNLRYKPDYLLFDGPRPFIKDLVDYQAIIHGDRTCLSIAAASILAKVTRDNLMAKLAIDLPYYGLETNKGYGTKQHLIALNGWGPSSIHRLSWQFMNKIIWLNSKKMQVD